MGKVFDFAQGSVKESLQPLSSMRRMPTLDRTNPSPPCFKPWVSGCTVPVSSNTSDNTTASGGHWGPLGLGNRRRSAPKQPNRNPLQAKHISFCDQMKKEAKAEWRCLASRKKNAGFFKKKSVGCRCHKINAFLQKKRFSGKAVKRTTATPDITAGQKFTTSVSPFIS